jgi:thioredoxin-like negative regulator of GroEL
MTVHENTAAVLHGDSQPRSQPKLVFFHSTRDGKSRRADGHLSQVLQRRHNHNTFKLLRVDVDKRPDLVARFNITELPTLLVIEENRVRSRVSQPRGSKQITELLQPWLS